MKFESHTKLECVRAPNAMADLKKFLPLFLALLYCFQCLGAALAAGAKEPVEWLLVQKEDSCGIDTLYITHDAIKIVNSRLGCQIVAKSPDWKVHCFQPRDKSEWIGKMEYFSGRAMLNPYFSPPQVLQLVSQSAASGTYKGLSYTKYGGQGSSVYFARDILVSKKIGEFLARFYDSPYAVAVPIYSTTLLSGNTKLATKAEVNGEMAKDLRTGLRVNLETVSCKKIPYNSADFDTPTNFKRSGDIVSVTLSGDKKSQFNEMLNNVGFMTDSGAEKKTK